MNKIGVSLFILILSDTLLNIIRFEFFQFVIHLRKHPIKFMAQVFFPLGGGSYTRGFQRWGLLRKTQKLIVEQHQKEPFDILHAIWADETGAVVNWVAKKLNIPSIVSIAGGELVGFKDIDYGLQRGHVSRWLVNQALTKAHAIIAPSKYTVKN